MSGVYDILNEQIGDLLTYDSSQTCRTPLRKSSTLCLQNGNFDRCRDGSSNTGDDSNTVSNGGDDESAGVRLSMGSVPMAVFWGIGQVFRAVGVMNGR